MAEILFILLVVLGVITVIGHAIWWMIATIVRALFGATPQPVKLTSLKKECSECGASLSLNDEFCSNCGRSQKPVGKPDPLVDLAMTTRQLDRFLNLGKIDVATHRAVMNAIEEERQRLTRPMRPQTEAKPVVKTPPPAVVVQPVVAPPPAPTPVLSVRAETEIPALPSPKPVIAAPPVKPMTPPEPPREPRRSFAEMLETFMEESSIRWGEIIGGLLIIGCSLALVISLWAQITAVPLLKFSVFVGVTAGLFGIGFYSAYRWKLPTTSRGALTISTLLVPLNFLAMTAFSQTAEPNSPIIVAGELIALMLFLFLVYQAGKVIAPGKSVVPNPWLLTGVTLLPSLAMLMAKHWQSRQAAMVWLGVAPMVCYWLGTGAALRGARAETGQDIEHKSNRVFLILGIASFATLLPCALFLAKAGVFSISLHRFAPFITLFAIPAIAVGTTFRHSATASGKTKTIATSIALFGAMLAMSGLALTWPRPLPMIGTALINCVVCVVLARSFDLKPAQIAALAFFALAYLIGANVLIGDLPSWSEEPARLVSCVWSRASGLAWMSLFVLFAGIAEVFRRWLRKAKSQIQEVAAVVAALFSLVILTAHGFGQAGDPQQLALVYLFFAASAFVIAWFRNQFVASWVGWTLALLTIIQALAFKFGYQLASYHPIRLSLLTLASLATVIAFAFRNSGGKVRRIFETPATFAALGCSIAVAPFVLVGGWMSVAQMTGRVFWLALIWLALSLLNGWRILFTAFQAALTVAVVCGVLAIFDAHALPSALVWQNPLRWQAIGIALATLSLGWIALRLLVRRKAEADKVSSFERLLYPPWPTVDRIVAVAVWAMLIVLSVIGVSEGLYINLGEIDPQEYSFNAFVNQAHGLGSWWLLLALLLVFVAGLWERFQRRLVLAMMTLLGCACLLLAGRVAAEGLSVQWLRWSAAISFALIALPIIFREQLYQICQRFDWPEMEVRVAGLATLAREGSTLLFALPCLILTSEMGVRAVLGLQVSREGLPSLVAPVFILSVTLAAYAIRENSATFALASGLLLNFAATLGCLWQPEVHWVTVVQANIITSALVSLAWLAARTRFKWNSSETDSAPGVILQAQVVVTLAASLTLLAAAALRIAFDPAVPSQMGAAIGNGWGWLAVSLSVAAWLSLRRQQLGLRLAKLNVDHFGVALLAAASLVVFSLSRVVDGWANYHALLIGVGLAAWVMFALRRFELRQLPIENREAATGWALALGLGQLAMTWRGIEAPNSLWWTVGSYAVLSLLFGWMAVALRRRSLVYLSAPLWNLILLTLFARRTDVFSHVFEFVALNVMVLSLSSLVWLWLDLKTMRPAIGRHPFHRMTILLTLPTILLTSGYHWGLGHVWENHQEPLWLTWLAILSVAALLVAYLWDEYITASLRGLHLIGVVVLLEVCSVLPISEHWFLAVTVVAFSLYALVTCLLWRRREMFAQLAERAGVITNAEVANLLRSWLLSWHSLFTAGIFLLVFAVLFDSPSLWNRLLATSGLFALPVAFALLTRGTYDQGLITTSVRLCLGSVVMWSWAWLSPPKAANWQLTNRLIIVMLIAEAVLIVYRLILAQRLKGESLWRKALRADLPIVAGIGLVGLAFVLVTEFEQRTNFGAVLLGWPAIVAVLVTLISVSLIGIAFAVLPGEDPFDLDERGKMRYVYLTEVFVVLTFMHLRLTMPWLFGGLFSAYWPIVVMLLAFAGVALSEVFRRQGKLVLAEPLANTGVLLPLLPVIGFWSLNSQVPYSGLLLTVGLFYGVLSVMKRSLGLGLLAALAGNSGLWHFLNRVEGLTFFEHPQLWLIPAAVSVLLAARINRESLSVEQVNSIRYGALVTIYVSSTADIFINGVDNAPWLPIILAVLAVGGVAAGLMMRIRAFLFLGTAFLLLSMLTIIWSASVNLQWTWLWYVTGIAFGVLIIYTVAMFERKREQMIGFVERLKQWQ